MVIVMVVLPIVEKTAHHYCAPLGPVNMALPTKTSEAYWIMHPSTPPSGCDYSKNGKWMLFYPMEELDAKWARVVQLYDEGALSGVRCMKVSTARPNPRASDPSSGVIIVYCGPYDDEPRMMRIGAMLRDVVGYHNARNGFMYYKTDEQTMMGTAATGQRRNWYYRLKTEAGGV